MCVMEMYREFQGLEKYVRDTYRLQNALDWAGYTKRQTHRAMDDVQGTIAVWKRIKECEGDAFDELVNNHIY